MWLGERDGYKFDAIVYPYNRPKALVVDEQPNDEMMCYILSNRIEQLFVDLAVVDCSFLRELPQVKYLSIYLNTFRRVTAHLPIEYDLTPVYECNDLVMLQVMDNLLCEKLKNVFLDVSRFPALQCLGGPAYYYRNIEQTSGLRSLALGSWHHATIPQLELADQLDTLSLSFCSAESLSGLENSKQMHVLDLSRCRKLKDISQLYTVADTITAIRIEGCNQISDWSVLGELKKLELLEITGSLVLPDLSFIKDGHPNTFILGAKVGNNDLTPCLQTNYAYCMRSYKTYNLTDKQLPKGKYSHGNALVEEWRRLE